MGLSKNFQSLLEEPLGPLDRVDAVLVSVPFVEPFGTSVASWAVKEALLLRLEQDGAVGWGECVADPDPYYAGETTVTARHLIQAFLLPEARPGRTLGELLLSWRRVRGNEMAKATVENAFLDLIARRKGLPLHALLGQPARPIPSGISIGLRPTLPDLLAKVEEAVEQGYHRVKLKIQRGQDVAWVAAVRERFPDLPLMADANGDYSLADADHLAELDAFALTMIEQPLGYHDIVQHARLQPRLKTPLCLDESIHSLDDAEAALHLDACRILNIKQGRVGGLVESARIAALCAARGVPVWSGGMDETGLGRALNLHLQTLPGFTLPGDTSETRRYFREDIADPPVVLGPGGWIALPGGPGTGVTLDPARLERYTLGRERLQPPVS
ncbi:o-succinylbenzoate synthase [Mesoterricola sediminis]|uniref:o-succinylbenzoate synthase n=1 Tax=Mesoterricola sediminis TaxID=2927980 RepID=UPI001FAEFBEE|nr:o-succinylbenzoate synthase [Mesoterricola sediminis]